MDLWMIFQFSHSLKNVSFEETILFRISSQDKEFEVQVASVVTDLAAGIGQFWPGFIGEIEGTDLGALAVAVEAQRRSQAPILITGEVSDDAFRILDDAIWRRCAFFDVPSEPALIEIQARGALIGFSAPPGAADVSWQDR
eukprot:g13529.t1